MVHFNMIDTVGRGIKKMYREQRNRFFPMPDYKIDSDNKEVVVTIYGKSLNDRYTELLKLNPPLTLRDCIWLDAVQKGKPITPDAIKELKRKGLIEGRKDNYTISLDVAQVTDQVEDYTKLTGLNRTKIKQMALQYIQNAGSKGAMRAAIFKYLKDALPAKNTEDRNIRLLSNLLVEMNQEGLIEQKGRAWVEISTSK